MKKTPVIVGLGETLWDVFPDGARLGGAPLNFACSVAELAQSNATVALVSAIGTDELGRKAVESIRGHQVEVKLIQTNPYETGQVLVELDSAGVASYRFANDSAWDHLAWNDNLQQWATDCQAVCFGTLGQRSQPSRDTIQKFVAGTAGDSLRVLDINLRAPFYNDEVIRESLSIANVLKLNDDELPKLASLCGLSGSEVDIMKHLAAKFQLRGVALTRGPLGAAIVWDEQVSEEHGEEVEVVDTVGAGDAFTAAMVLGILAGLPIDQVNRRAIATAAYVCSQPGATMQFPNKLSPFSIADEHEK